MLVLSADRVPLPGCVLRLPCSWGRLLARMRAAAAAARVLSRARPRAGLWNGVPVAIKVVPSYKIAKVETAMQEAVLSSNISHPNVVRLHSVRDSHHLRRGALVGATLHGLRGTHAPDAPACKR
jgi:hypothetical protein